MARKRRQSGQSHSFRNLRASVRHANGGKVNSLFLGGYTIRSGFLKTIGIDKAGKTRATCVMLGFAYRCRRGEAPTDRWGKTAFA